MVWYLLTGAATAFILWLADMYFLGEYQGRKTAGMAFRKYLFTPKKFGALFLAVLSTLIGCALLYLYGFSFLDMLKEITVMNILSFLALIDKRDQIVPNKYLIRYLLLAVLMVAIEDVYAQINGSGMVSVILYSIMGAATSFLCMLAANLISRGGIGAGDIKLLTVTGLLIGFRLSYLLIMIAVIIAAGYSIVQLIRKKITMKSQLPFVPYLAAAMIVIVYLGI